MKLIAFFILSLALLTLFTTLTEANISINFTKQNITKEINNNSITEFNHGLYYIYCNNVYEGSIIISGTYNISIYLNNSDILIILKRGLITSIKNLTFYNNGSDAYLLLYTNDSSLKISNITTGKYSILNIPGVNQTYYINDSNIEINMNTPLNNLLSFSQSSWTIYQFSNNSSLYIIFGKVPINSYNLGNINKDSTINNVIILNNSNILKLTENYNNIYYNIIYYSLLALSLLTLGVALVATNAKKK
ncbi:hypothetical protein [Caldisphaera sp.]|uniref:hypothetical protein n=1 Tax=Caldisphaera sp. TaxID=2060322 RepID=UPI0025C08425|nr:hypothetical protein [Caldisphaera sp.]